MSSGWTLAQIDAEILKSDSSSLPPAFVAIAVQFNEACEASHAGIVMGDQGRYFLFHYPRAGSDLRLENPVPEGEWYFHKALEIIEPDEALDFRAYCKRIIAESPRPQYGFLYDGSYFEDGKFWSPNGLPFMATCVSVCLMVIAGFLQNHEFIKAQDWDAIDNEDGYYLRWRDDFERNTPISDNDFAAHIRRITPLELMGAAFFEQLPIPRAAILSILEDVELVLRRRLPGA